MKRMIYLYTLLSLLIIPAMSAQTDETFEIKVKEAVTRQMEIYPASTLKDLYKNFFQDKYGPGHLINNPESAANYLQRELGEMTESSGDLIEPTGWEGNFYRVNLSLIKEGIIPYDIFFDAFVRSVNGITPVPVDTWKEEWNRIEKVIHTRLPGLPGYEEDKKQITERLENGEYVGHHSEIFEQTYSPHYRIVGKEIFEKELLPLLQQYLTLKD
ncbi:MAG: hypothetical protein LUE98_13125 [Tannerellaceae bacterium]|nr:hypothetical protein [Tannerellaceae bacterium]